MKKEEGVGRIVEELKELGRGRYGRVSLVRLESGDLAALKEVSFLGLKEDERERTLRDFSRIFSLSPHPHVIRIFTHFPPQPRDALLFLMEYAPGGTLEYLVDSRKGSPFTEDEIILMVSQIISGVEHIHKWGLVHGDLSPMNVLIGGESGRLLKISDFGEGGSWRWRGTLGFAAPEIISGCPPSPSSDVYSIGSLLWFLASLSKPPLSPTPLDPSSHSTILRSLTSSLLAPRPSLRPDLSQLRAHPLLAVSLATLPTGTKHNIYFPQVKPSTNSS